MEKPKLDSTQSVINTENIELSSPKSNFLLKLLVTVLSIIVIGLLIPLIIIAVKLYDKNKDYNKMEKKYNQLSGEMEKQYSELIEEMEEKYNELLKNMTNSGNGYPSAEYNASLSNIFDVFQNLIRTTNVSNENIDREQYKDIKAEINSTINLTDGTYDLLTKEPIENKDGYQVSFETDDRNYQNGYYTDEEYDELIYKLAAILNVNASLGVYESIPEVSYYIKDKNVAVAMAALFNQISIWDWKNDMEILNQFHQKPKQKSEQEPTQEPTQETEN